ncbi:sporulation integral membrane protein YtvI [Salibacterium salarium]|uniref:Sporulation integral membrane protein YtvI n=1 Tax=Salibacterium salarium TaxID=284579 RepID=A0A3R9QJ87_9BACI|nr:sporulation integral membrane protein YtvI [Salibacterium salarium]RSL31664.1 sporulation integral membrane protein YtvI [Salibacterium salarium]
MKKQTGWIITRSFIVIVAIAVLIWAVSAIFKLTYPFWLAALFAWMLKPLSTFLHHKAKFPKGIAALTALLIGLSIFGGIITGLTFLIIDGVQRFADKAPSWMEQTFLNIQQFFNQTVLPVWQDIIGVADNLSEGEGFTFNDGISEIGAQIGTALGQFAQRIADGLTQVVMNVPTFLVAFLFILLSIYFIGKDWERIIEWFHKYIPRGVNEKIYAFKNAMWGRVFGYIRAQLILMFITGIIVFVGLSILQIESKIMLAVIVGIAEVLPYLGTGTILLPWAVYLLVTGHIGLSISLAVLYSITMVVRQTIEPKVLSSSMNLNPIAVLVSLFAGLQLFGAVGLLLGPVLLVLIVIFIDIGVFKDLKQFIMYGFKED